MKDTFGSRIFAHDQVKMRSLGWAIIPYVCVPMKRGNLDTETRVKKKTEIGMMLQRPANAKDGWQTTRP